MFLPGFTTLFYRRRYDRETSVFTPPRGSWMFVRITSLLPTEEVVKMLLAKYQVESEAAEFALYVVKENGGDLYWKQSVPCKAC